MNRRFNYMGCEISIDRLVQHYRYMWRAERRHFWRLRLHAAIEAWREHCAYAEAERLAA